MPRLLAVSLAAALAATLSTLPQIGGLDLAPGAEASAASGALPTGGPRPGPGGSRGLASHHAAAEVSTDFTADEHDEHPMLDGEADMVAPRRAGGPWKHVDLLDPDQARPAHRMSLSRIAADTGTALGPATGTDHFGSADVPGLSRHVSPDCSGTQTGNAGNRVQAIYAHEQSQPDRYAAVVDGIKNVVAGVDDVFALSSRQTGGGRRVRWVQDGSCEPLVLDVTLPDGALGAAVGPTWSAIQNAGYTAPNRKYLVFADYTTMLYNGQAAGVGDLYLDDSPTGNLSDGTYSMIARLDVWSTFVAGHELMHNLGAVQRTSPNHSDNGHCTDGRDVMCYPDGSPQIYQWTVCQAEDAAYIYDCNHDDYFNTDPAPSSYLATHWNTANSSFLADAPVLPDSPTITLTPEAGSADIGDRFTVHADSNRPGTTYSWQTSGVYGLCTASPLSDAGDTAEIRCSYPEEEQDLAIAATGTDENGLSTTAQTSVHLSSLAVPTVAISAPESLTVGVSTGFVASGTGKNLTYAWSVSSSTCALDGPVDQPSVSVTCGEEAAGTLVTVVVSVTQSDGQEAWGYAYRAVVAAPDSVKHETATGIRYARGSDPARFTGTLTETDAGGPVADQPLTLQVQWVGSETWVDLSTVLTDDTGTATASAPITTRAGSFRFAYPGNDTYAAAGTRGTTYVKVGTAVRGTVRIRRAVRIGVVATTRSGARLGNVVVTLQSRRRGTASWTNASSVTTNARGRGAAVVHPRRKTFYRWVLPETGTRYGASSNTLTVRGRTR